MKDFKVIVDNGSNVAASMIKNVPESSREYRDRILESVKTESDAEALWQRLFSVIPKISRLRSLTLLRKFSRLPTVQFFHAGASVL